MAQDPDIVQANPFDRQWAATRDDVVTAIERVGASGWYILGSEVERFESEFAQASGLGHAIGCGSGLDAIEIGLRALGLKPGEEVLTTPLSAFATTLAILRAGGRPVFVDVDDSGLLDLDAAARTLSAHPELRFMVPVHLFGHALDMDQLAAIRDKHDLLVVEDAAQAVFARSGGRAVGTVGAATAFSFYPTKNLGTLGDGGCVATGDASVARACRSLRDYGQSARYFHDRIGLNSRLDEVHAAVLRSAYLPRLAAWTERRREIAELYRARLDGARVPARSDSVWHLFPMLVDGGARDALLAHLRGNGIQAGIHYPRIIPQQAALDDCRIRVTGKLVNAERFARDELSLPIHPFLRNDEVERVISLIEEWQP